ncbi:hypothetical protein ACOME3_003630 [Neoechinorhynchus agilis]
MSTIFSCSQNGMRMLDSDFLSQASSSLLNSSSEIDVQLLERVVDVCYNGQGTSQRAANSILTELKSSEDAWLKVDSILSQSCHHQTRYIALQILEEAIKKRWKSLPEAQCEAIKRYVISLIINRSMNDTQSDEDRTELKRLNTILVEILKYEWPHRWPSFVSDLVKSSLTGESICANNMQILKLLSQEVFDFSSTSLTRTKALSLRASMCTEFGEIFELCYEVLDKCLKDQLVLTTLETLLIFLNWIPRGYLLETTLIELLVSRYMAQSPFRNVAVKCMTEIASIDLASGSDVSETMKEKMVKMMVDSVQRITEMIPDDVDLAHAYNQSHDSEKDFIMTLTMYLSSLLRHQHFLIIRASANSGGMIKSNHLKALSMLVRLSRVDETEVFKVCVEFWIFFGGILADQHVSEIRGAQVANPPDSTEMGDATNLENARMRRAPDAIVIPFAEILSQVRYIMIEKMARPEEVIIVETENGEVVREFFKDTDAITL